MRTAADDIREVLADIRPSIPARSARCDGKEDLVLDVLFVAGILALGAVIALVARAVEKL